MSLAELKTWCEDRLAAIDPSLGQPASADHANTVAELKQKCLEAGLLDFALTLPIEAEKFPISAVIQLKRCLQAITAPPADATSYNVSQVARLLGVSKELIYKLCADDEFPHTRYGRRIVITAEQLADFQSRPQAPTAVFRFL